VEIGFESRQNLTAARSRSLSPGQMCLTLVDLTERRSLIRVQIRIGVRVGYPGSAGIVVLRRWKSVVALSSDRHHLLRRARGARNSSTTTSHEK
jgi:hypothetical protein